MIRKSHFLLALALALAATAIGVPVAHAVVKSPYEYLGHPTGQDVDPVSAVVVKSPYEYLGHPTGQDVVDRVSVAAGRHIDPLAASTSSPQVAGSTAFQWGDAGIGAAVVFGIVLLVGGAGAGLLISRRNGRKQAARA